MKEVCTLDILAARCIFIKYYQHKQRNQELDELLFLTQRLVITLDTLPCCMVFYMSQQGDICLKIWEHFSLTTLSTAALQPSYCFYKNTHLSNNTLPLQSLLTWSRRVWLALTVTCGYDFENHPIQNLFYRKHPFIHTLHTPVISSWQIVIYQHEMTLQWEAVSGGISLLIFK